MVAAFVGATFDTNDACLSVSRNTHIIGSHQINITAVILNQLCLYFEHVAFRLVTQFVGILVLFVATMKLPPSLLPRQTGFFG